MNEPGGAALRGGGGGGGGAAVGISGAGIAAAAERDDSQRGGEEEIISEGVQKLIDASHYREGEFDDWFSPRAPLERLHAVTWLSYVALGTARLARGFLWRLPPDDGAFCFS